MWMNGDVIYRVRREENQDQMRQAARWRFVRDAGLLYGVQFKRSACRLLCQLGRALVALGEQLEQAGRPRLAAH